MTALVDRCSPPLLCTRGRLSVALVVAVVAAGCGGCGSSGGPAGQSPESTAGRTFKEPPPIHGDTVEVVLDEYVIQMPDTIPPGPMVFHVRNAGFEGHNIEIRQGDSIFFRFPFALNPYEEKTSELALTPGRYRVVCPESGHATKGMDVSMIVSGEAGEEP